jgi:acetyltransferase
MMTTAIFEFALIISDRSQGRGFGTQLLRRLVQIGRDEQLDRIVGLILASNHAMLAVARQAGFTLTPVPHEAEVVAELLLKSA